MHSETRRSSPAPRGHTQHPHLPGERKASAGPGGKPASSRGPRAARAASPPRTRVPPGRSPGPRPSCPLSAPGAGQARARGQHKGKPPLNTRKSRPPRQRGGGTPAPRGARSHTPPRARPGRRRRRAGGREHRSRRLPRWAGRHLGACGHPHRPPLTLLGNKKAPRHPVPGQVPPGPGASGPPGLRTPPGRARALPRGRSHEGPGHPRLGVEGPGSAGPGPRAPGASAQGGARAGRPRRARLLSGRGGGPAPGAGPRRPPAARGGGASTHTC